MVFTKLSKEWVNQFTEFGMVVKDTIIPSCFLGPSSPHFDLKDAQCQMAIVESANCMKELFNLSGEGLVIYLRDEYMRQSLQCNNEIIDEYLQALTSKDIKGTGFIFSPIKSRFTDYLKSIHQKNIKPLKSISILYESIFWSNSSCVMSHSMSQMLSHLFFAISSYHQTSYLICFRICCYAGFPPHLISSRRIY